jgi:hypothetical protein
MGALDIYSNSSAAPKSAAMLNRERQNLDQQGRIVASKKAAQMREVGQHSPGSGVLSENSLARPPAWERVINPRGIDPYSATSGPTSSGGIANPPPMTNFLPGDAGRNSLAEHRVVQMNPIPAPLTSPAGNRATDAANLAQNERMYAPGGMLSPVGSVDSNESPRSILDRYQTPGTVASVTRGGVTDATGASMAQNGAVTPAPQAKHWTGFNTAQDAATARTNSLQSNPEIGQTGSAANQAFVAYAKQYGEPAAHQNIASITQGGTALNPNGNNAATAIPIGMPQQTPTAAPIAATPTPPPVTTPQAVAPQPAAAQPSANPAAVPQGYTQNYDAQGKPTNLIPKPHPPNFMGALNKVLWAGSGGKPPEPQKSTIQPY